jgi:hypothetical protein
MFFPPLNSELTTAHAIAGAVFFAAGSLITSRRFFAAALNLATFVIICGMWDFPAIMIILPFLPVTDRARSSAMEKKVDFSEAGRNCFGSRELLAGQSREPEPPAIIRHSSNIIRNFRIIVFFMQLFVDSSLFFL